MALIERTAGYAGHQVEDEKRADEGERGRAGEGLSCCPLRTGRRRRGPGRIVPKTGPCAAESSESRHAAPSGASITRNTAQRPSAHPAGPGMKGSVAPSAPKNWRVACRWLIVVGEGEEKRRACVTR